jgi:hypothetical protein
MVKSLTPRGPNGYWPKGVSGNPGGRPHAEREMVELARKAGPDVIRMMIEVAADESRPMPIRLHAGSIVLDRAFGKAREYVDITNSAERAQFAQAIMALWTREGIRILDVHSNTLLPQVDDETGDLKFLTIDPLDAGL